MTLIVQAHPLEDSYSRAMRDVVCESLESAGERYSLARLANGDEPDLDSHTYDRLVAICPTWWGGPPAVLLDWLQRTLGPIVDGGVSELASPFASIREVCVVSSHGSSRLMNRMQGEPGRQTWQRVVLPLCAEDAELHWISLYKIDRSTLEQRQAFLDEVRSHFC